jgi:hypothetical protein
VSQQSSSTEHELSFTSRQEPPESHDTHFQSLLLHDPTSGPPESPAVHVLSPSHQPQGNSSRHWEQLLRLSQQSDWLQRHSELVHELPSVGPDEVPAWQLASPSHHPQSLMDVQSPQVLACEQSVVPEELHSSDDQTQSLPVHESSSEPPESPTMHVLSASHQPQLPLMQSPQLEPSQSAPHCASVSFQSVQGPWSGWHSPRLAHQPQPSI